MIRTLLCYAALSAIGVCMGAVGAVFLWARWEFLP